MHPCWRHCQVTGCTPDSAPSLTDNYTRTRGGQATSSKRWQALITASTHRLVFGLPLCASPPVGVFKQKALNLLVWPKIQTSFESTHINHLPRQFLLAMMLLFHLEMPQIHNPVSIALNMKRLAEETQFINDSVEEVPKTSIWNSFIIHFTA